MEHPEDLHRETAVSSLPSKTIEFPEELHRKNLDNNLSRHKKSLPTKYLLASSSKRSNVDGLNEEVFRKNLANTLERRSFYMPSFKIYGGVAGLYDYGPPGCSVKSNVPAPRPEGGKFINQCISYQILSLHVMEVKVYN